MANESTIETVYIRLGIGNTVCLGCFSKELGMRYRKERTVNGTIEKYIIDQACKDREDPKA